MSELAATLLTKVSEEGHHGSAKVTVVGTGQVGMAAAFAMMTQVYIYIYIYFQYGYISKCIIFLNVIQIFEII